MGVRRYVRRARLVARERQESLRPAAAAQPTGRPYRPTIPGSPTAVVARRVSTRAGRWLDRRERRRFKDTMNHLDRQALSAFRRGGHLRMAEIDPQASPARAYASNQDLVVQACEDRGIEYFVVPESGSSRTRIGVPEHAWPQLVAALIEVGTGRPVYVAVEGVTVENRARRYPELTTDARLQRAMASQSHLEVFTMLKRRHRATQVFDRPYGCHVERWRETEDGALAAPSRNERTTVLGNGFRQPATIWSKGRQVRTLAPFATTGMYDIDFPIDVVYMWVDGSDEAWLERKNAALVALGMEPVDAGAEVERFRDNGELRYSMRSVEMYAPWVRNIYLVTDSQVPSWLDAHQTRVTVVDHRDIFGDAGALPSFNSHAIGARLHHIQGLSEHYIHFNDDFFLGRPVLPQLFFQSNGVSKFFLSRSTLGFHDEGQALSHEQARRNVVDLLHEDFGRSATRAFFHTPIVQRRSTMLALEKRYPEAFAGTWRSQFRSHTDHEINSWLHHNYGYLTGAATPGSITYDYFDIGDAAARRRMQRLARNRDFDTFCINDSATATDRDRRRISRWLAQYYPEPASWEVVETPQGTDDEAQQAQVGATQPSP